MLESLPLSQNSDGFVFDNEMLAQAVMFGLARFLVPRSTSRKLPQSVSAGVFATGSECLALR